jgi:hypothetical protein
MSHFGSGLTFQPSWHLNFTAKNLIHPGLVGQLLELGKLSK